MKLNDQESIRQQFTTNPPGCVETPYNRYVEKVYQQCLSLIKDADKAQDYTRDIFTRTFDRLDRFEGKSTFSTWFYSIAFNYGLDQLEVTRRLPIARLAEHPADQEKINKTLRKIN